MIQTLQGDAGHLPFPDNHFDCLVSDPPYGYGFMGKDWDKAVVGVETWKEVLRVMKPGAFGFIMSAPRQDVLSRMIVNLQEAGFEMGFTSIYWTYGTGFPKASNISKAVDKRLGVEREAIRTEDRRSDYDGRDRTSKAINTNWRESEGRVDVRDVATRIVTAPASPQAQALDGSYAGFQPKPAVEVILVVMKPLTERTYLDQAMKDGKGVTWLEAGRIPIDPGKDDMLREVVRKPRETQTWEDGSGFKNEANPFTGVRPEGRFPANLLVSDDVLDDGVPHPATVDQNLFQGETEKLFGPKGHQRTSRGDTGTFSRYFDLDAWWRSEPWVFLLDGRAALPESARKTYPFLIVPKASKSEKNQGCRGIDNETYLDESRHDKEAVGCNNPRNRTGKASRGNIHPTVKPIKLMSYLIAIGSRPGDLILDPFMGSGTTLVAAKAMGRRAVGVDNDPECIPVAEARVKAVNRGLF